MAELDSARTGASRAERSARTMDTEPTQQPGGRNTYSATVEPARSLRHLACDNEIGRLRRLLIHAPDEGIGNIFPHSQAELLYDDIVDLAIMRQEYATYYELLLWVLDPQVAKGNMPSWQAAKSKGHASPVPSVSSPYVIEFSEALTTILLVDSVRAEVVYSVAAHETLSIKLARHLMKQPAAELAQTLITGRFENRQIFSPLPNLIFTRDLACTIGNNLLLTRFKEAARSREALLMQFVSCYALVEDISKLITIDQPTIPMLVGPSEHLSIEGGDVMMIAPGHLIIGVSARTCARAIDELYRLLTENDTIDRISVIVIPKARGYMHIDTIFTQVKRDLWVVYGPFSGRAGVGSQALADIVEEPVDASQIRIHQMSKDSAGNTRIAEVGTLEALLESISMDDFGCARAQFVYSAGGQPVHECREQWTDACNFLVLHEGVIVGYDRNHLTNQALEKAGFTILAAEKFNQQMREGADASKILDRDTVLTLPSSELSRARGGSHCMSMPLWRDGVFDVG